MSETLFFVIIAVAIVLVAIVVASYVKAPPAVAFIISGLSKTPRVLIGKGGFRLPFFERLDKVYLGQISVDIKTENAVPTRDFINVDVDAVAKIRVTPTEDGIRLAAKNFLNMEPQEIVKDDSWLFAEDVEKRMDQIFGGEEKAFFSYMENHKEEIKQCYQTIKQLV